MKFKEPNCPTCKTPAKTILETVLADAELTCDESGNFDYAGESDVSWDSQESFKPDEEDEHSVTLSCSCGVSWDTTTLLDPTEMIGELVDELGDSGLSLERHADTLKVDRLLSNPNYERAVVLVRFDGAEFLIGYPSAKPAYRTADVCRARRLVNRALRFAPVVKS